MKKLVVLKFYGNFTSGFQVSLEIANEGQGAYETTTANLLENISIPQLLNNWHEIYCSRYAQFRIKSGGSRQVNLESLKQECTRESINLLASFNQWLNTPSFSPIVNSLKKLNHQDEIRIIITTSCHELRQLPWHLWDILTNFPLVEVALSSPNAERGERVLRDKIRILIILGDSSGINIEADKKLLHSFCGDDAEIVLLQQPSRQDLNYYLQDDLGWDILFFSGHSQTQEMQGKIYISHHESLTMGELRDALQVAIQKRLQIAFFNSCDGLGIAYELEQLHIPQVIVMREPVPDKVAQEFLKYFLQEFTGGKSLYISVRNARVELQKLESDFPCASWLPIIMQNQTEIPPTWQSLGIIAFCPYQGLSAFKEENAEYFFGRDKVTASLVNAVNSRPLVAVVGASGSGKSSLVFAGLIPQLRGDTINNWLILSFRPGKNPFAALAVALVSALNLPDNERRLAELELDVNLQRDSATLERFITDLTPSPRILLIADQFEEIYTLCTDAEERKIFLDGLLKAVNNAPFFTLLLTLRADFLSRALDDYEPFGRALQQYQLEPVVRMNREELEAAITLPAKQLGFEFEEGLCNTIIDDIQDGDGRLPLLEFTLTQLWKQQCGGRLTHQAYKKIGGVEQALANYADMVYADLSAGEREKAQRVFIQLVQPGEGTEDTRRLATSEEVGGENWDLVTRLADKRLVVTNRDELRNEETVEVVHEALIRHWGRLRGWMQENRKFRIWQQGLMVALQQWVESGKDEGALLRGATLAVAEDWLQQRGGEVSKPQRWFIEKSVELRERERKQKERLRRSVIAGLVCGLVVISGFAGFAWWQWREARIREINTQLNADSLSMEALLSSNLELDALLKAVKTGKKLQQGSSDVQMDTRMRVIAALRQVIYGVKEQNRLKGDSYWVTSIIFSKDGTITSSASNGIIQIWSKEGKELRKIQVSSDNVSYLTVSPDNNIIASGNDDGTIKFWSKNGRVLQTFKGHLGGVRSLSFSHNSKIIASAGADRTIKLWSENGRLLQTLKGHINDVQSISISPDGNIIASGSVDNTVKLWNKDGRLLQTLRGHSTSVNSVTISPNGNTIASGDSDQTIKLWNKDGRLLQTINGYRGSLWSVSCVSFSPDGNLIASGLGDGTIKLLNIKSGELKTFKGHYGSIGSISFSPDGNTIASFGYDEIKLWNLKARELETFKLETIKVDNNVSPRSFHSSPDGKTIKVDNDVSPDSLRFSPNGKAIVLGSDYGSTVEHWSKDGKLLQTLTFKGHQISLSPDANILASANRHDGTIKLWTKDASLLKTIQSSSSELGSVSFSPDGKVIASAGIHGTINLWSKNGTLLSSIKSNSGKFKLNGVSFSPDSSIIASFSDEGIIKLWSKNGKLLQTIKDHHPDSIDDVSLSSDGKTIAVSTGRIIKLWSKDGKQINTLKGHIDRVSSVTFSPDGNIIASASIDGVIKLWSKDGRLLQTLKGYSSSLNDVIVNFSPDGKILASVGEKNKIILWNFDLDNLLKKGCDWLNNYLQNNPDVSKEDRRLCDNIKNN